ncbi:PREDICTED: LOW QUALITY PROTEIN: uncharacterized protein LOC108571743 [Habropoda laboriosa]|uniref:LOW QUALITY PROTEIN: uncharacterized protein LOC108571743 n=1 Tax=Habropoda laboriosa TaxID=597456 RepID=UPI00083E4AE5|nr:PREDICTED: LOW QUALITY PROTEIN: uncharacterized protein LOC108571743 [Habropoda laboriosa]
MSKLCCFGLSLATRIISTYTMSISILMVNLLMSNYFSRETDNEFFDSIENWGLFGLNWLQVLKNSQMEKKKNLKFVAQTAVVFLLVYTILFLLTSAYLALGSISRKPKCAVPWMYLQMINIIDQSVALSIHLTHGPQCDVYDKSIWYIPVSSVYLLLCAYFWMVVQAARKEWSIEQRSCTDFPLSEAISVTQPSNGNEPKSPSFLSQNFSMFDSPRPPTILPK